MSNVSFKNTGRGRGAKPARPGNGLRPVPWHWLQALCLGLIALLGADVIVALIMGGLAELTRQSTGAWHWLQELLRDNSVGGNFTFYALSRLLGLGAIAAFVRGRSAGWGALGFRRFKLSQALGLLLVAGLLLLVATVVAFAIISSLSPEVNLNQAQDIVFSNATTHLELALAFVALVVIAPVAEETIFRGFMLPAFAGRFGFPAAAFITAVLFGVVHWQLNVGVVTFLMALLLAWLYKKTGSLWPAILFHSLKNLIAFLIIF